MEAQPDGGAGDGTRHRAGLTKASVEPGAEGAAAVDHGGRRVRIPWSAIRSVEYSPGPQWFVLRSGEAQLRVSLYVSGLEALAEELARQVPSLAETPGLKAMRKRRAIP